MSKYIIEEDDEDFFDAVEKGDIDAVREAIAEGTDLEVLDEDGLSTLWLAAVGGYMDIVELLIENGVDVDIENDDGETALLVAAGSSKSGVLKLLIDKGANVNASNGRGDTALINAASSIANSWNTKFLLNHGADVNAKNKNGKTALMFAALRGRSDIVKILIENGADIYEKDDNGETALDFAKKEWRHRKTDNTETITLLEQAASGEHAKKQSKPDSSDDDITAQLEKLKKLHDAELIDDDEYKAKKAELLEKL